MFRCMGVMGVKGLWGGGCRAGRGVERSRFGIDLEVVYKYRLSLHKAQWMTYAMTDPGFPVVEGHACPCVLNKFSEI